jgi:hypothetical protein
MNHQPYRDWLLSEQDLSNEQLQALQDHLRSCESCGQIESSWMELEMVLQKSLDQVEPASGFTERWQAHLADYQYHQQKRSGWLTISATALIVTSLLVLLIAQLWSLLQSPGLYLAEWINRVIGVISIYYTIQNLVSPYSWQIPVYTFITIFFLVGVISFMSVLWLATYRKFSMARRAV